jgi:hypothetical protein
MPKPETLLGKESPFLGKDSGNLSMTLKDITPKGLGLYLEFGLMP